MINNFVTEISETDFRKLNLIGFKRERIDHENWCSMEFIEKKINDVLDEQKQYCKEQGWTTIVIALHVKPSEEKIQEAIKANYPVVEHSENKYSAARSVVLTDYSYYDKWLNKTGATTYQIGCGIEHLYSTRDYWCIKDDYWQVKKKETEAVYLIHLEF